jgi:5-(carboxyamino)imidazole ribonucleotide synthase
MTFDKVLPPGATIGILGGGQLGLMLALAAGKLGLKAHIFAPEADSPAFHVCDAHSIAPYADEIALAGFAKSVSAVTYEFENVPVATVAFLEGLVPVRPGSKALAVAQDRIAEKNLARSLGAMTAEFAAVNSLVELRAAVKSIGLPAVLKTRRFGYDGKGQAKILDASGIDGAWDAIKGQPAILERFVDFHGEMSVIAARGLDGAFAAYDVTENVHRDHILHTSTVPAAIDDGLQIEAKFVAQQILAKLDYVGIMGVEFFVGDDLIYVNEIAPRVHNSGHWTQDACVVSQFEQHIRAVAGWPLGSTRRHSDVVMTNLLGDEVNACQTLATVPGVGLHLYGKTEVRKGRKMGHYNRISPRS